MKDYIRYFLDLTIICLLAELFNDYDLMILIIVSSIFIKQTWGK